MTLRANLKIFLIFLLSLSNCLSYALSLEDYYLVFDKARYQLELRKEGEIIYSFEGGYGLKSLLYKIRKGDFLTPEGIYQIKAIRPSKNYFYFIEITYPNENDLSLAYFMGVLKEERIGNPHLLGTEIGIHGGGPAKIEKGKRDLNWTQGCIALSNEDLKTLLKFVRPGQKVFILNSSKPLYEILKKLVYPVKVKPLEFWEGELYLKLNNETYWYFYLHEKKGGLKTLIFKEWIRGRLNKTFTSQPDGSLENEEEIKRGLLANLYLLIEPKYRGKGYLWK